MDRYKRCERCKGQAYLTMGGYYYCNQCKYKDFEDAEEVQSCLDKN